jgi:hypothetical protein
MIKLLSTSGLFLLLVSAWADSPERIEVFRASSADTSQSQGTVEIDGDIYQLAESPTVQSSDIVCVEVDQGDVDNSLAVLRISSEAKQTLDAEFASNGPATYVVFLGGKAVNTFLLRGGGVTALSVSGDSAASLRGAFEVCANAT